MKKALLILSLSFTTFIVSAQVAVKKDETGDYRQVSRSTDTTSHFMGTYYVDKKGERFPIYKSAKSQKTFVYITSKKGTIYRKYLNLK